MRLAVMVAIAFLLWHVTALVVAPYADSGPRYALRAPFSSYLRVAPVDHRWMSASPRPDAGRLIRYQIVNGDGQVAERVLSEAVPRSDPGHARWVRLYDRIAATWPEMRDTAAGYLCSRHTSLAPRGIRFVVLHQLTLTHDQYLHGVRPTDPETLRRETLPEIPCR